MPYRERLLYFRWYLLLGREQIGKIPLLLGALALLLMIYWWGFLRAELTSAANRLEEIHRTLDVPLPVDPWGEKYPERALTTAEYQQVKALFAILEKYHLQAKESRYQIQSDIASPRKKLLTLELPLQGQYLQLYQALSEISAAIPVALDALSLSRHSPESKQLTILLRITLSGARQ